METIVTYDKDSKRYHRYLSDDTSDIKVTVYIPKGKKVTKQFKVTLTPLSSIKESD